MPLKHRELMAQGQHFGAKPGLGPASNDMDFEQEANHDVDEGVEHERGVSHWGRGVRLGTGKSCVRSGSPSIQGKPDHHTRTDGAGVDHTGVTS